MVLARGSDELEESDPLRNFEVDSGGLHLHPPSHLSSGKKDLFEPSKLLERTTPPPTLPKKPKSHRERRRLSQPSGNGGAPGTQRRSATEREPNGEVIGKGTPRTSSVRHREVRRVVGDTNGGGKKRVGKGVGGEKEPVEASSVRVRRENVSSNVEVSVRVVRSFLQGKVSFKGIPGNEKLAGREGRVAARGVRRDLNKVHIPPPQRSEQRHRP